MKMSQWKWIKMWEFTQDFSFPCYLMYGWARCSALNVSRAPHLSCWAYCKHRCGARLSPASTAPLETRFCHVVTGEPQPPYFPDGLTGMPHPTVTGMGCFKSATEIQQLLLSYSRFPQLLHMASYRRYHWSMRIYFSRCIPKHEHIHHLRTTFFPPIHDLSI